MDMKKVLIIEDEQVATQHLSRLLEEVAPDMELVATLQSVEESVEYFNNQSPVDLVFMDIHLADGLAFHIFDQVAISCPIIFTTAYDQYALDAFKVNSIDYLLKPINRDDLTRALDKLRRLTQTDDSADTEDSQSKLQNLIQLFQSQQRRYKSYFLIPLRDKLVPLQVSQIAYIHVDESGTRLVTFEGTAHTLDKPLDTLQSQLDPELFFRANRQFIVAHNAVKDISLWPIGKLHLTLTVPTPEKIIVSRARASEFKEWYTA